MADLSNFEFRKALRHRPSETKVDEVVQKKKSLVRSDRAFCDVCREWPRVHRLSEMLVTAPVRTSEKLKEVMDARSELGISTAAT